MRLSYNRYQPASASELLSAFRALDPERTGTVSRECMESALRHDGEPFEDEELEEMMSAATIETAAGGTVIPYELYINKILVSVLSALFNFCFVSHRHDHNMFTYMIYILVYYECVYINVCNSTLSRY